MTLVQMWKNYIQAGKQAGPSTSQIINQYRAKAEQAVNLYAIQLYLPFSSPGTELAALTAMDEAVAKVIAMDAANAAILDPMKVTMGTEVGASMVTATTTPTTPPTTTTTTPTPTAPAPTTAPAAAPVTTTPTQPAPTTTTPAVGVPAASVAATTATGFLNLGVTGVAILHVMIGVFTFAFAVWSRAQQRTYDDTAQYQVMNKRTGKVVNGAVLERALDTLNSQRSKGK